MALILPPFYQFTGRGAIDAPSGGGGIPNPPVAGYVLYLNSDSLSAGAVALWPDLSGNGNDAVQATMSKQPVTAAGGPDGHLKVTGDGVDDFLSGSIANTNTTATGFIVMKMESFAAVTRGFAILGVGQANDFDNVQSFLGLYDSTGSNPLLVYRNSTAVTFSAATGFFIYSWVFNGTNIRIFINGVFASTVATTGSFDWQKYYLFCGLVASAAAGFSNISIVNKLVYTTALSDADRQSVQAWLVTAPMYPSIVLGQPQITRADFSGLTGLDFVTGGVGKYFAITTSNSEIFVVWFNTGTETPPSYPGGTLAFMATITALSTAADIAAAAITASAGSSGNVNTRFVCSQSANAGLFQDLANATVPTPPDAGTSGAAVSVVQTGSGNS